MPLHEAIYLASADKIYGVSENYVMRFNPDTGVKEAEAKVCAPCYGPMRITGSGTDILVSSQRDYSLNTSTDLPSNRRIWNIDPTTLAATDVLGVDIQSRAVFGGFLPYELPHIGPHSVRIHGGYAYYQFTYPNKTYYHRVKLDGTDYSYYLTYLFDDKLPEVFDIGDSKLWIPDPYEQEAEVWTTTPWGGDSYCGSTGQRPVGIAYSSSNGKTYGVTGGQYLVRYDSYTAPRSSTNLNLWAVYADVRPMRIRESPLDGNLYIPCQNEDVVIVWDTGSENGTYVEGFASPIDVVFTDTKAWAVQSSGVSLLEIT